MKNRTFGLTDQMEKILQNIVTRIRNCYRIMEGMPGLLWIFILPFTNSLVSCEEPFTPDLRQDYSNLLVVEGLISTDPGPYVVRLSRATTVVYPEYNPVTDSEVIIMDNQGHSEMLSETEPGVYTTATDGIQGIAGNSYKIQIKDSERNVYESAFEKLPAPVDIDTIYPILEYHYSDVYHQDIPGYRFNISTQNGDNDSLCFRWQLQHTWQYASDYQIYLYYDGKLHVFPDPDSLQTCWITEPVYSIFTTTAIGLDKPVITDYPLHYIGFDTRHFSIRYSLLVKQLTISRSAWEYWDAVKEQTTASGNLYTHLPYQIKGNIKRVDDENEPVLGYFQVAGINVKRIFINRPPAIIPMHYPICELSLPDYEAYGWMFYNIDARDWPEYVTIDGSGQRALPDRQCTDCREKGGTIVKPDFWIDN